jgi:hypothetical protein
MVIALPQECNIPKMEFDRQIKVIHGIPKVGKTSIADGAPDAVFLATGRRCDHVRSAKVDVDTLEEMEDLTRQLATDKKYKTVVVDELAMLWQMAETRYCKMKGIKNMLEEKYPPGPGWCQNTVHRILLDLAKTKTLIIVAHSAYEQMLVPMAGGGEVLKTKWIPECAPGLGRAHERIHEVVTKIAYMQLFVEMVDGKRVIHPNPSEKWEAGVCVPLGGGKLPDAIVVPDGSNGYQLLREAYEKSLALPG